MKRSPCLPQLENARRQQRRPSTAKNKQIEESKFEKCQVLKPWEDFSKEEGTFKQRDKKEKEDKEGPGYGPFLSL